MLQPGRLNSNESGLKQALIRLESVDLPRKMVDITFEDFVDEIRASGSSYAKVFQLGSHLESGISREQYYREVFYRFEIVSSFEDVEEWIESHNEETDSALTLGRSLMQDL